MTRGGSFPPNTIPWSAYSEDLAEIIGSVGGETVVMKAAQALNIGDGVFISGVDIVDKSTTVLDYAARAGIVVGGQIPEEGNMAVLQEVQDIGEIAASAINKLVLVCVGGICRVVADGVIAVGDIVEPDSVTAGRVSTGTTQPFGVALEAAAGAGDVIRILVRM
jgi:hypothetical protein